MLAASWSVKILGIGLLAAAEGVPSSGTGSTKTPRIEAETETKRVDLSSNLRLVLGSPDHSGQLALCFGAQIAVSAADPSKRAVAVADLELRHEFMSSAFHASFGDSSVESRSLYVISGDLAMSCVSAPGSKSEPALSVVLESLRTSPISDQKWSSLVQKWRNHEGLGAAERDDRLQRQLQSLIWLGTPDATASITGTIAQSPSIYPKFTTHPEHARPQRAVIVVVGDYSQAMLEKRIRSNTLVREFTRGAPLRSAPSPAMVSTFPHQNPRFARERIVSQSGHRWLFGWPISQLDANHESTLHTFARLLERRLYAQNPLGKGSTVTCAMYPNRGFGSFLIEINSRTPHDLDMVEKWVFSAVDRIGTGSLNRDELSTAIAEARQQQESSSNSGIERALTFARRSLIARGDGIISNRFFTTPTEVARTVERDFRRATLAEIFAEALPPSVRTASIPKGSTQVISPNRVKIFRPSGANKPREIIKAASHRGGRVYAVQNGESLQMIAARFHVSVGDLIRENHLSHPDQIRPGTRIVIPQPAPSAKIPQ